MTTVKLVQTPKVYLAGKISNKDDWRTDIVGPGSAKYARLNAGACVDAALNPNETMSFNNELGRFIVTGPFYAECNHGCTRNIPHLHGVVGCCSDNDDPSSLKQRRDRIHAVNLIRIRNSDFVFARINQTNCFGTMAEIGFAHGIGKPIYLHYGYGISTEHREELWFVERFAKHIYMGIDVELAFKLTLETHYEHVTEATPRPTVVRPRPTVVRPPQPTETPEDLKGFFGLNEEGKN